MKRPTCCQCGEPADVAPLAPAYVETDSYCFACAAENDVGIAPIPVECDDGPAPSSRVVKPARDVPVGRRAQRAAAAPPHAPPAGPQLELFGGGRRGPR